MASRFTFGLKSLFWFTAVFAVWCGVWSYMVNIMSHYATRYFSTPMLCLSFIVACAIPLVPLRGNLSRLCPGGSLAVAFLLSCYLNAVIFCIVSVYVERN